LLEARRQERAARFIQDPGPFVFELVSIFDRRYVRIWFGEGDWEEFDSDEAPYASAVGSNLLRSARRVTS
jgi:hypothetical protein